MEVANHVKTPRGPLHVGDVVTFGHRHHLGRILLLAKTKHNITSDERFWAALSPYRLANNTVDGWLTEELAPEFAELPTVSSAKCYTIVGNRVFL